MKICKVFELSSEVKLELTQDDIDDIMDVFIMYISDKYNMKYIDIHLSNVPNPNTSWHSNENSESSNYSYEYNKIAKRFDLVIRRSSRIKLTEFNRSMKLLKDRLSGLGFSVSGHASDYSTRSGSIPDRRYYLEVWKPMFPVRKKTPLTQ